MYRNTVASLLRQAGVCLILQINVFTASAQTITQVATGFDNPAGVCGASHGSIYLADFGNHVIKKVDAGGTITIIAGTGNVGYSGDGGLATQAELNYPYRLCVDDNGNIYFSDQQNNVVRKINTDGIITTVAGIGRKGYEGDNGPAIEAQLNSPLGVCVDQAGNLYIADGYNQRIRKVDTSGIITTIAGSGSIGANNGTYSGDGGQATQATLNLPTGIAVDNQGNLYITEEYNSIIRKINTAGIISTVAGNATEGRGYAGDGGPAMGAKLNTPLSLSIDATGNIYVTDESNYVIRKISASGTISTIAGTGTQGKTVSTGIAARQAALGNPNGIYVASNGTIYFTDNTQNVLYKITN